jgi:hypothetical protein
LSIMTNSMPLTTTGMPASFDFNGNTAVLNNATSFYSTINIGCNTLSSTNFGDINLVVTSNYGWYTI